MTDLFGMIVTVTYVLKVEALFEKSGDKLISKIHQESVRQMVKETLITEYYLVYYLSLFKHRQLISVVFEMKCQIQFNRSRHQQCTMSNIGVYTNYYVV